MSQNINITIAVLLLTSIAAGWLVRRSMIVVQQETVVIIERFGRFHRLLLAGPHFIVPFMDQRKVIVWTGGKPKVRYGLKINYLDLREQIVYADPTLIITKDNISLEITPIVYWRIVDVRRAVYELGDLISAILTTTTTTLRSVVGELELDQTLVSRDLINQRILEALLHVAPRWGIEVNRIELVEITPPADIRAAMEKQMRAERERRARIIEAEGLKQAQILNAEGGREAAIRQAEGQQSAIVSKAQAERASALLAAEAEEANTLMRARVAAQAATVRAQAEAEVIERIYGAYQQAAPTRAALALKYMEMMGQVANGKASKVYLPYDGNGALGLLAQVRELWTGSGEGEGG